MLTPITRPVDTHPQGEFHGRITSVVQKRSENSGRFLSLTIQTPKGTLSVGLYPESKNTTAQSITSRNTKTILMAYVDPPAGRFDYFLDIQPLLKGLPVQVYVSNRGDKMNVYFREVHKAVKVRRQDGRIIERVSY